MDGSNVEIAEMLSIAKGCKANGSLIKIWVLGSYKRYMRMFRRDTIDNMMILEALDGI